MAESTPSLYPLVFVTSGYSDGRKSLTIDSVYEVQKPSISNNGTWEYTCTKMSKISGIAIGCRPQSDTNYIFFLGQSSDSSTMSAPTYAGYGMASKWSGNIYGNTVKIKNMTGKALSNTDSNAQYLCFVIFGTPAN